MPDGERFWHIHELDLGKIPEDVYLVIGSTGVNAPTSKQVAKVARMLRAKSGSNGRNRDNRKNCSQGH